MEARCAIHPDLPAAGTCQRCGAFACSADLREVAGLQLCATCAARPEANYLEQFRLKLWGKRDVFAWVWGVIVLFNFLGCLAALSSRSALELGINLVLGLGGIAYFLGRPWARQLIFLWPAMAGVGMLLSAGAGSGVPLALRVATSIFSAGLAAAIPLGMARVVYTNARNQLFFRVPMTPEKLQQVWEQYANDAARRGHQLSLAGLVIPGLGLLGVVFSVHGLMRADPEARPPIGRGAAVRGIVVGMSSTLLWALLIGFYEFFSATGS